MRFRVTIKATLIFLFIFSFSMFSQVSAAEKVFKWRAQGYAQPGSLSFRDTEKVFDDLRKATNGRLDIRLYGAGALVGPFEAIDAIGKGIFEVGLNAPGYYSGKDPAFAAIYSLAGVWPDSTHAKTWLYYFGGEEFGAKLYDKYNLKWIGPIITSPECLLSTKPIRKLDDLKGLKIRTTPGLASMLFQKLGASPVPLPSGEIYSALDTKVIDAAEYTNLAENKEMGLLEVTKYVLDPSFHCPLAINDISVNKNAYNKLPDDLKAALRMMTYQLTQVLDYSGTAAGAKALREEAAKGKIEHFQFSDADMKKARMVAIENAKTWRAKNEMSAEIIDSIFDYLKMRNMLH
jgi:TRAP-type mannitol/chloroaromatic compound transport system substrate-binding protein